MMHTLTFVLYTNSVSAHQLPLAREIVRRVGDGNFRYVYTGDALQGGKQEVKVDEPWIVREEAERRISAKCAHRGGDWLEDCDVLLVGGIRPIDLMERRLAAGKTVFYMSERWFKPIPIKIPLPQLLTSHFSLLTSRFSLLTSHFSLLTSHPLLLPGWLRLLHPRYFRMARRFVKLFDSPNYRYLPIGPHAARDMRLLCRVMHPLTSHFSILTSRFIPWGYFVAGGKPSTVDLDLRPRPSPLRLLWIGRPLWLKRVDTIRKAVAHVPDATLDVFTDLSLEQVREEMRRHDIFVFASNALDGWGAVVSEALSEGMTVLGTYETGASAALLPKENLFHAGDWRALVKMLRERTFVRSELPHDYTPAGAAERLMKAAGELPGVFPCCA